MQAAKSEPWSKVSLWGYGEVYYLRPTHKSDDTKMDLARAVFGLGYQFDDKTRFNSEYEVEHAVASADDPGEFEVEQFYVDRKINEGISARGGLFLIPAGLLNENHEPTNFYGVQRNFVETLIIPSTWREGGLSFYGTSDSGFEWNAGLTTGMDLSKWDFAPEAPLYTSALELINNDVAPFQATHQELALANAKHLSQYVALNYRGVPGLTVGGTYFTGQAAPALSNIGGQRTSLWETHVRYQPGKWDLSGLYAMAASATPRPRTRNSLAPPTRCRRASTAGSCRPPTTSGRAAAIACRPSAATSTTTWAPAMKASRRASPRPRPVRCRTPARRPRSTTSPCRATTSPRSARISISTRTSC